MALRNQAIKMGTNQIKGLADGTDNADAVNLAQMQTAIAAAVPASGSITNTMLANMPASTIKANLTGANAAPDDKTLTQVLDGLAGNAQGALLYRGASAWSVLAPGASGQFLKTLGASANPAWDTVTIPTPDWTLVKKTADQAISSSTAFANDTELSFVAKAGKTYAFRGAIIAIALAGGYKIAVNGSSAATKVRANGTVYVTAYDTSFASGSGAIGSLTPINGAIVTGGSDITVTIRLAQLSSSASTTTFEKGSWLEYAVIA